MFCFTYILNLQPQIWEPELHHDSEEQLVAMELADHQFPRGCRELSPEPLIFYNRWLCKILLTRQWLPQPSSKTKVPQSQRKQLE